MTNEREMLEYAAKACDRGLKWWNGDNGKLKWNPLTNSADCAAMCAKLRISTNNFWEQQVACLGQGMGFKAVIEDHNNSREAAWRYAATMVAAKVGGMK